jgi:hypothetical protein
VKRIVSVSLGSSKRNASSTAEILGEEVVVERIGTDGSIDKAIAMIRELDGKVDAFGMGGIDLYVYGGGRRYSFRTAKKIAAAAQITPMVDGSGLKNTLERRVVRYIDQHLMPLKGKKVLMPSALDRFGMADAITQAGCETMFGDLMFGLGLNIPIRKQSTINTIARILMPIITQLPFTWVYPTGEKQDQRLPKFAEAYQWADIIAGDALYILRHMPDRLDGKVILTNTVTKQNVQELKERGVSMLVTTTPNLGGRSFGTNVMEGLIVAAAGKTVADLSPADYEAWLDKIGFVPRVERFDEVRSSSTAD